jgi:hydrogenase maturation protease
MGAKKVSMHQAGFQEVLSSAQLSGEFPAELALIGVQPELLNDYGGSLTAGVRGQLEPAVEIACQVLKDWGVEVRLRPEPLSADELMSPGALDIGDYESGRPLIDGQIR